MSRRNLTSGARAPWKIITAVAATAALALTGCASNGGETGSTEGGGSGEAAAELQPLSALSFLPLESFTFTPEMVAHAGGFFEDHGLDVDLQSVQGTSAAIQSLIGGAADITRASSIDSMPAMEAGQPIVSVGTMTHKTNLRVVSADSNPIESGEDMVGQTIGMGSIGGTSEKTLDLMLNAHGIEGTDVERQSVPVTGATFELVKQGQLAGYIVSLDTSIAIQQQNSDAVISTAGLDEVSDVQTWLVTQDTVGDPEKAERITAFMAAIRDAVQFVIDDAPNNYENVLAMLRDSGEYDFPALNDDAIAKEALDSYTTQTWVDPETGADILVNDFDKWSEAYASYTGTGLVQGDQDASAWMTDDLLPKN